MTDLTIDQALGQKLLLGFEGTSLPDELRALLRRKHIAGVTLFRALNIESPAQVRELTAALQAAARAAGQGPLLIALDQEGGQLMAVEGGMTRFPGNLALGATGSTDLAYRAGYALGRELAAIGVNVNYAPSCDVNSNPHNPVIGTRSLGEDPALVSTLTAALVRGMQTAGVAATVKHFPGHGDTASDSHYGTVVVEHDQERIRQVELPPFAAAIEAGVKLVMTAHLALPAFNGDSSLPATLSPAILRGLLRGELGFDGVIISDAMKMEAIDQGPELAVDALAAALAGVDLLLLNIDPQIQTLVDTTLRQAAKRRLLDEADIRASAGRVLALKRWIGLQSQPKMDVVGCAEHIELAQEIADRSITLVRDDAGLLPLRLAPEARVAVVVPRPTDLTPADTSSYASCALADQLRRYHPQVEEFIVEADPDTATVAWLQQRLGGYDLVIAGTINATAQPGQAALVQALLASRAPLICVALRTPYDLSVYPQAPTYLCAYSILPPALDALARALFGHIPLVGRLPVSIPNMYPLGHGLVAQPLTPPARQEVRFDVAH
jgi:beta-N-acetylhexosaminidase